MDVAVVDAQAARHGLRGHIDEALIILVEIRLCILVRKDIIGQQCFDDTAGRSKMGVWILLRPDVGQYIFFQDFGELKRIVLDRRQ